MGTGWTIKTSLRKRVASLMLAVLLALSLAQPTRAQALIRDTEIEHTLKQIALPLLKSAGVNPGTIEILVVDDSSLNAFVVNSRAIFIHVGMITRLEKIEMLQAVIAHELAHITSGHTTRRSLNQQNVKSVIGVGMLLAVATAAVTGSGKAASGIALGTAGSAVRNYLAHTRAEETTADKIGARYMARAGIDPAAAVKVLEIFRGQEALSISRQDPYTRSHPLSRDRIRALKGQVAAFEGLKTRPDKTLNYWYGRMQAKFRGFRGNPAYVLRHVKASDTSEAAILTRAIAHHRQGNTKKAIAEMNTLLHQRPKDAFYHELKGQILLEGRQASAAAQSYKAALAYDPGEALVLAGYGRALLSLKTKTGNRKALEILRRARQKDGRDARMLRDLAVAWAKTGNNGMASLVTAERYALLGRFKDALTNAERAEGLLRRGSAGWLRAEDIIAGAKSAKKR